MICTKGNALLQSEFGLIQALIRKYEPKPIYGLVKKVKVGTDVITSILILTRMECVTLKCMSEKTADPFYA